MSLFVIVVNPYENHCSSKFLRSTFNKSTWLALHVNFFYQYYSTSISMLLEIIKELITKAQII